MEISDAPLAKTCLERIGYYRLSGYWYPFRKSHLSVHPVHGYPLLHPVTGKKVTVIEDEFRAGTNFAQCMELYVFDKRLRLIFLDAIERIEVALRVDVALLLGRRSPYAHRVPANFNDAFTKERGTGGSKHNEWLNRLDESFRKSNDEFVKHFKQKYAGELPPLWIAIELWDFGTLSTLLAGLKVADQQTLAKRYGLRPSLLLSFARNINNIRNICAHHSRLWNRSPADRLGPPEFGEVPFLDHLVGDVHARSRIYGTAAVMQHFLGIINPSTHWARRLLAHLQTLPCENGIDLSQAGFPSGWTELDLWKESWPVSEQLDKA